MAPKPQAIEQKSQATPFAERFLEHMMGQIQSGFATPLQQNMGAAANRMINPERFDLSKEFSALQEVFNNQNATGLANLREQFSAGGSRYGSATATGTGRFMAEAVPQQQALMAQITRGSFEDAQNRGLQALQIGSQFSIDALRPFLELALSGIHPDQIFMQENPWLSGLKTVGGLASGGGQFLTGLGEMRGGGAGGFSSGGRIPAAPGPVTVGPPTTTRTF